MRIILRTFISSIYLPVISLTKKIQHSEICLDLQNLTYNKGRIHYYYDETEPNSVGYLTQVGFFPNLMYRVYF